MRYKKAIFKVLFLLSFCSDAKGQPDSRERFLYKLTSDQILKDFPLEDDSIYGNHKYRNLQFNTLELSFIGNYQLAIQKYDLFYHKNGSKEWNKKELKEAKKRSKGYIPKSAVDYILTRTKDERIVIINEAHIQTMHRVFTTSLLKELYAQGFRYLALEALSEDSLLNIVKTPVIKTGYYTRDPQFGNMIREASAIGYKFVAYEYGGDNWKMREQGQALNIKKILDKDTSAKILIHCGYGHGKEDTLGEKLMGAYVKKYTGINPLTIEQINLTEHFKKEYESSDYLALNANFSAVFLNKKGEILNNNPSSYDIEVYHPRTKYINGRPDWLVFDSSRSYYFIPEKNITIQYPFLAIAYLINEDTSIAIPVDIIELTSLTDIKKALVLKKDKYKIILRNSKGEESSFNCIVK